MMWADRATGLSEDEVAIEQAKWTLPHLSSLLKISAK